MAAETPTLEIREANPADAAEMVAFQDVYERAERAEFPDADVYTLEDAVSILSRAPLGWLYRGYAAFEAGRMVGEGLIMGSTTDNLRTATLWVWVAPEDQGRGVGRAVCEHLIEVCRRMGRDVLQTSAKYPAARRDDHPYRRFAESLGFVLANTEVERRLALPVPTGRLDDLAVQSAPYHQAYELRVIIGPIPAELAASYCDVQNRLGIDAPSGDLVVEVRKRTPEILADQDVEILEQGRTRVSAVAIDATGTVVALTSCTATPPGQPGVTQMATIVRPDHRGHRLGMAVKVAQIRTVQTSFPDKSYITTTNAETNAQMVAINEALGFEQRALEGEFQRLLSAEGGDPAAEQLGAGVA
jgi:GNAT superfamily N-acetyltransferase